MAVGGRMTITLEDFARIDIRIGTIVAAAPNPAARKPAYRLEIDFGPELGRRTSSAQLTANYRAEDLPGRQVAAVLNFPPRRIAGVVSEVLVLGFPDGKDEVVLVGVDRAVPNGGRLY